MLSSATSLCEDAQRHVRRCRGAQQVDAVRQPSLWIYGTWQAPALVPGRAVHRHEGRINPGGAHAEGPGVIYNRVQCVRCCLGKDITTATSRPRPERWK